MEHLRQSLAVLLLGAVAVAQEAPPKPVTPRQEAPPDPVTVEQAAEQVLAALRAEDAEALEALAGRESPDPWLVADELCAREEREAALRFAAAAGPAALAERIPSHLATEEERVARERLGAALADPGPTLEEIAAPEGTITLVRLLAARGAARQGAGRPAEAASAYAEASRTAEALGWLRSAALMTRLAGTAWEEGGRPAEARKSFERLLALGETGAPVDPVWVLTRLAWTCDRLRDHPAAESWARRKLAIQEAGDDEDAVADSLCDLGIFVGKQGRFEESLGHLRRALGIKEGLGEERGLSRILVSIGLNLQFLGDRHAALSHFERALSLDEVSGSPRSLSISLINLGDGYAELGVPEKALLYRTRALEVFRELGDRKSEMDALGKIGNSLTEMGRSAEALGRFDEALRIRPEVPEPFPALIALSGRASALSNLGRHEEARAANEEALALARGLKDRRAESGILGNMAVDQILRGDFRGAAARLEEALAIEEERGDPRGLARTLGNMALAYQALGAHEKGLELIHRAREIQEAGRDRAGLAATLGNLGSCLYRLGRFGEALHSMEEGLAIRRELKLRAFEGTSLQNIALVRLAVEDFEGAAAALEEALAIFTEIGLVSGQSAVYDSLGNLRLSLEDWDRALEMKRRALALARRLGERESEATALAGIGNVELKRGNMDRAAEALGAAEAIFEKLGVRGKLATVKSQLAVVHHTRGNRKAALETARAALALGEETGDRTGLLQAEIILAQIHQGLHEYAESLAMSRRAVVRLGELSGSLAETEAAAFRERWWRCFATALEVAVAFRRPADTLFFLESAHASTLLTALGGRDSIEGAVLPPGLRGEELAARAAQLAARKRLERAGAGGVRSEVSAARQSLEEADRRYREAVQRIQREAKRQADLVHFSPAGVEEIQGVLEEDEEIVLYFLSQGFAFAMAIAPEGTRLRMLGLSEPIEEACRGLALDRPGSEYEETVARVRELAVAPLDVPEKARRILVAPHGALAVVPFRLLLPGREVVRIPSATTYRLLREEERSRPAGRGVLALGDPEYGAAADRPAEVAKGGRGALAPLPRSREEAEAVGDVVLLGKEATEEGLAKAIAGAERWRAVHLACHGLVDGESPMLSALAIAPGAESDGFLSALEILRLRFPADLVTLSACDTARGKAYRAEGTLGLTRAFMLAGAPRVLSSLWKVDDEATRALMVRFYELWNPQEGEGLPAAAALRQAQEFVRSHEKWRHPYYWAPWMLWGLPD